MNIINDNGLMGMTSGTLREVNNLFKQLLSDENGRQDIVHKTATTQGITTSSGLTWYDLQPGAKLLYPVLTPLRNEIPRVPGDGDTATHWKAITGINVGNVNIFVGEGQRNKAFSTTTVPKTATYATIGMENSVSFEADEAAEKFDDAKSLASRTLLQATMLGEEGAILGGNASLTLGLTPTPNCTFATTGGAISVATTATISVIAVALAYDGYVGGSVSTAGVVASVTRVNADASTDTFGGGVAIKSTAVAVSCTTCSAGSIACYLSAVPGAVAYAWYWGAAGAETIGAITAINSYVITANTGLSGGQVATAGNLPATDNSTNALAFDGLISQICATGSGSYVHGMATGTAGTGTPLTANSYGGITEIDAALKSFWDNYRVSPEEILVNAQELMNITNKAIAGGTAPLFRFNVPGNGSVEDVTITAGTVIGTYLNKFAMGGATMIRVRLHPNVPPGMIIFRRKSIPYPLSNVTNIMEIKCRRDYYQIAWPLRTRKYEFGTYASEVLAIYFLPAFGIIYNIGNG